MPAPVRITFLGGLGEIGRNCMVFEVEDELMLLDCGLMFPELDMLGIDLVLPDFTYLRENAERIEAAVLTHGHEDHVGALHHLLARAPAPVYGTPFTLGLIAERVASLPPAARRASPLVELVPGQRVALSEKVAFTALPVAHSIPQAVLFVLEFPAGRVVHTGDFKLAGADRWRLDPDLLARLAPEPLLVLADSTGATTSGATPDEAFLADRLLELLTGAPGRVFVTVFSSHIARIRGFLAAGAAVGRSAAAVGRSMERYAAIARELGLLPEPNLTSADCVRRLPPEQQMYFISGSQGEASSAMDRLSRDQNPQLVPGPGDTVVFSVSVIPGRELPVGQLVDRLLAGGAAVRLHTEASPIHVSGHGTAEELGLLYERLRPRTVIPLHGSLRYLIAGREVARSSGAEAFLCLDGHRAVFEDGAWRVEPAPGLDGVLQLENPQDRPVDPESLQQRRRAAITGVAFVTCALDRRGRPKAAGLQVSLLGVGRVDEHPALIAGCSRAILEAAAQDSGEDAGRLVELAVRRFFKTETGKKPQVVVHLTT
jgi:ribonuclease J